MRWATQAWLLLSPSRLGCVFSFNFVAVQEKAMDLNAGSESSLVESTEELMKGSFSSSRDEGLSRGDTCGVIGGGNHLVRASSVGADKKTGSPSGDDFLAVSGSMDLDIRVYAVRWLALGLFCLLSFSNACIWISFSTIADYVKERLSIGDGNLNLLSTIYMIVYIPFMPLASLLIDRLSLGAGVWTGAVLNMGGAWLRYWGALQGEYWTVFWGQLVCALAQTFILGIPAKLSAVWFPPKERALSTGIAVFANQLGNGAGLLLGTVFVSDSGGVVSYMIYQAIFVSCIAALILPLFGKGPPAPPSVSEAIREKKCTRDLLHGSLRDYYFMIRSFPIFSLVLSYGMNVGVFYGISTFLSPILKDHHENADDEIGWCGFIMVAAGLVSAVLFSVYAGKTSRFYLVTIVAYIGALVTLVLYTLLGVQSSFGVLYAMSAVLGFFLTGLLPVGVEYAAEIAYPIVENISSGMLNISAQVWGIIIIFSLENTSPSVMLWSMCGILLLGSILCFFISRDLRRESLETRNGCHANESTSSVNNHDLA